jgi:hypothetical protein
MISIGLFLSDAFHLGTWFKALLLLLAIRGKAFADVRYFNPIKLHLLRWSLLTHLPFGRLKSVGGCSGLFAEDADDRFSKILRFFLILQLI